MNTRILPFSFALSSVLLLACSDEIVYRQGNWPAADTIYTKDPSKTLELVDDMYRQLPQASSYSEMASDDAVSNRKEHVFVKMADGLWSPDDNPLSAWDAYSGVDKANKLLYYIDRVEWGRTIRMNRLLRETYKGEAIAVRAYYHTQLLMAHAGYGTGGQLLGIPVVREAVASPKSASKQLERMPFFACVDTLFAEYDRAVALLQFAYEDRYRIDESGKTVPDTEYNAVCGVGNRNRISGRAALAMKARLALYAASPAFNNGSYNAALCDSAVLYAGRLIDDIGGLSTLERGGLLSDPIYFDNNNDATNREIIWGLQEFSNSLEKKAFPPSLGGEGDVNPSQNYVDAFPMANGYPIDVTEGGYVAADPYTGRDGRLAKYVLFNGGSMYNRTVKIAGASVDAVGKNGATRSGYYLKKGLREDITLNNESDTRLHVLPISRYTEVFLIYAEALNQLEGPAGRRHGFAYSSRDVINALRTRAGISSTAYADAADAAAFTELIRNERRIELGFEGFRFWDIRRWNLSLTDAANGMRITERESVFTYRPIPLDERKYEPYMRFAPIPNAAKTQNRKLEQNSGW